jgi:hypothetical protein
VKVYLNKIDGIADAIVTMFISKRTWTRELEVDVRNLCDRVLDRNGFYDNRLVAEEDLARFRDLLYKVTKWGKKHITMLRYIDFSVTVEGLHRAGQDDFDSHAKRLENRIVRSSTRLATFNETEKSDWYRGKILYPFEALEIAGIDIPDTIQSGSDIFVRTAFGYIKQDLSENKDVKRGLYPLAIPSVFTFKCNLTELAHIRKERDKNSTANPEVKEMMEQLIILITDQHATLGRALYEIEN